MATPEAVIALNLSRAIRGEGEVTGHGLLDRFDSPLAPMLAGPLSWRVRVASAGDELWLDGWLEGVAVGECARCLEPVPHKVETRFQALLQYRDGAQGLILEYGQDDDQERYLFGNPQVDLTPLAAEFFELALPTASLCDLDCPGLDTATGRRREAGREESRARDHDPRWKALEDLDLPGG